MGDFREADYTLPDHVLQSPVNDDRWDERGSEVETAPDPLPRPFPEPRAGVWSASACLGGCFWEGPSIHLLVTSCWVFSGWLPVAVDSGGTVVLVSQDGIQRPPFRFPKGGHLLQFLSCLENGLLPHGQLDPPLWSQRGKVSECGVEWGARGEGGLPWGTVAPACGSSYGCWAHACLPGPSGCIGWKAGVPRGHAPDVFFQGKVFPKLRKRSPQGSAESTSSDKEDDEATDYVFRIIYPGMQSEFGKLPCSWALFLAALVSLQMRKPLTI